MDRPLTRNIHPDRAPLDYDGYVKAGGYAAVRKALEMSPSEVVDLVKDAELRGLGGAGFPTGLKWSFVPQGDDAPRPKYLVANGDEMEPGTFKDRLLLEGDPHSLIEGMIVSGYAIEADVGYVFLRWAYHLAAERITAAIREARDAGMLGENILGSGWSFDLHLHSSAGRYMCGEETGLLNALEGRRATPRAKPPYPQISGLWGKPTVVQNIETLCNVPHIVNNGTEWFHQLGRGDAYGTKLYGVSGKVKRPGVWELPMGTTIGELLDDHAGGMRDGLRFRGVQPGGASTAFLTSDHLDVPMDFRGVQAAGSRMGTGTMIVLDDQTCPVGMVHNLEHFFAQESCGWCTPCREGLAWTERILAGLEAGDGQDGDLEQLQSHAKWLGPGLTFCALAPGAADPLQSALRYFREDFEQHVREKRCPWRNGNGKA